MARVFPLDDNCEMKAISKPRKIKSIDEIERENAKIFGRRKPKKTSFDSVKALRELRG